MKLNFLIILTDFVETEVRNSLSPLQISGKSLFMNLRGDCRCVNHNKLCKIVGTYLNGIYLKESGAKP
jgi:hypothetical protein